MITAYPDKILIAKKTSQFANSLERQSASQPKSTERRNRGKYHQASRLLRLRRHTRVVKQIEFEGETNKRRGRELAEKRAEAGHGVSVGLPGYVLKALLAVRTVAAVMAMAAAKDAEMFPRHWRRATATS